MSKLLQAYLCPGVVHMRHYLHLPEHKFVKGQPETEKKSQLMI